MPKSVSLVQNRTAQGIMDTNIVIAIFIIIAASIALGRGIDLVLRSFRVSPVEEDHAPSTISGAIRRIIEWNQTGHPPDRQ